MNDQWCVLELLGHRRLVGLVSECEVAGAGCLRIDVADPDGGFKATQYYFPAAIYGLTVSTEEAIRAELERLKARPALALYRFGMVEEPEDDFEPEAAEAVEDEPGSPF